MGTLFALDSREDMTIHSHVRPMESEYTMRSYLSTPLSSRTSSTLSTPHWSTLRVRVACIGVSSPRYAPKRLKWMNLLDI